MGKRHSDSVVVGWPAASQITRKRKRGERVVLLLLFVQSTRPTPDHGRLERAPGGGPEHERVAVAAGEQLVPPRAGGARAPTIGTARWVARV